MLTPQMFAYRIGFLNHTKREETMETTSLNYGHAIGPSRSVRQPSRNLRWAVDAGARRGPPPATVAQARAMLAGLTRRESQVLAYVVRGVANKVIAAEMQVSQRTIEAHRSRIFLKMGVRNAVQLVSCLSGGVSVG